MPTQWEYQVVMMSNDDLPHLQDRLASHGRAGWELVTVTTTVKKSIAYSNDMVLILKRPTIEPADVTPERDLAKGTEG